MSRSQFYDSSRNEICCTDAIGRVQLRIVGGTSLGLSIIQVKMTYDTVLRHFNYFIQTFNLLLLTKIFHF